MNNDFEIRTYGKSELAMLYFPDTETPKGALSNLNFYIDNKPGLLEDVDSADSKVFIHGKPP